MHFLNPKAEEAAQKAQWMSVEKALGGYCSVPTLSLSLLRLFPLPQAPLTNNPAVPDHISRSLCIFPLPRFTTTSLGKRFVLLILESPCPPIVLGTWWVLFPMFVEPFNPSDSPRMNWLLPPLCYLSKQYTFLSEYLACRN